MLSTLLAILVMIVGFGFVIFWHELGHFLGARWAGMRVEQFAVGMGHAVVSYRKGIGLKFGNTMAEFEKRVAEEWKRREWTGDNALTKTSEPSLRQKYDIAKSIGLGETEYRLSWIPIGGYVKPTGQDDLRPAADAARDDPGSYAAAPVGKRMVMISAGVIMNVILAGILFFILFFFIGFEAPRAVVSGVQSNSPAAQAGVLGGDELLELHGKKLHDFTKVHMWTALMPDDEKVELKIRRDGKEQSLWVEPRPSRSSANMLAIGIEPPLLLRAASPQKVIAENVAKLAPEERAVMPGERIVAVNGQPVKDEDYAIFDRALQSSYGGAVTLTVEAERGERREETIHPLITSGFDGSAIRFANLSPRTRIEEVSKESSAFGQLQDGDIVLSVRSKSSDSVVNNPSTELFRKLVSDAGENETALIFSVQRGDQVIVTDPITPTSPLADGKKGLGVGLMSDFAHPFVGADTMAAALAATQPTGSPQGATQTAASIPAGAAISAIDGQPVLSWYDVHRKLASYDKPTEVFVAIMTPAGEQTIKLPIDEKTIADLKLIRYISPIRTLDVWTYTRETGNPLTAVGWGTVETRDLILQTYITLRRVFGGSVPASNLSGPIGIFQAGTTFAQKGPDWFIWFLALVSANLAVVNFLPVPILDGWHFLSLLKEKITGTPVNERVQEYASWVGLVLILSLFLFVTFNDIMRL